MQNKQSTLSRNIGAIGRKQGGFSIPMLIGIIALVGVIGTVAAKYTSGTKMDTAGQESSAAASTLQMQKGQLVAAFSQLQGVATGAWAEFGAEPNLKTAVLGQANASTVTDPAAGPVWPIGPIGTNNSAIAWKATTLGGQGGRMLFTYTTENVSAAACSAYNKGVNGTASPVALLNSAQMDDWAETASGLGTVIDANVQFALGTSIADSACVVTKNGHRIVARLQ